MAFRKGAALTLNLFRDFTSHPAPTRPFVSQLVAGTPRLGPSTSVGSASRVPIFSSTKLLCNSTPKLERVSGSSRHRSPTLADNTAEGQPGPREPKRWFQNETTLPIVVLLSCGAVISVCSGSLETVPYTNRKHLVLMSRGMERKLGGFLFKWKKASFKGKILPPTHPDSIRVRLISQEIINALERGRSHQQDVSRVQKRRKKGRRDRESSTSHLEGLNWEVVVVDDATVNAFCMPGGKIVVFTGLLKLFWSDEEIATVIGHEVGHAVARHVAEGIAEIVLLVIVQLIGAAFMDPEVVAEMSKLLLRLPFSRNMMEMEADYIGLMLMASAGYDPRVAPKVFGMMGEDSLDDYLSTHPSGTKRAQKLSQARVMEEALTIYREVRTGRDTERLCRTAT